MKIIFYFIKGYTSCTAAYSCGWTMQSQSWYIAVGWGSYVWLC